jgi:hemoglobin-like flavoprotein
MYGVSQGSPSHLVRTGCSRSRETRRELTSEQRLLVQLSLDKVVATSDAAFVHFYQHLFELDPALREMFARVTPEQDRKFRESLGWVVEKLDEPDTLLPELRELGVRHVQYGVTDDHYDTFGAALIWALERSVGATFTPEVREAWEALYAMVAGAMKRGAGA